MVEYLHDQVGCRTLFATHYHELTDLEKSLAGVKNLQRGGARMAGRGGLSAQDRAPAPPTRATASTWPGWRACRAVIERGKEILAQLEEDHLDGEGRAKIAGRGRAATGDMQLTLFGPAEHPLLDELRAWISTPRRPWRPCK